MFNTKKKVILTDFACYYKYVTLHRMRCYYAINVVAHILI